MYSLDYILHRSLAQVHSLDYLLNRYYYKCTAYIIYSTNFITHVQLALSTQQI